MKKSMLFLLTTICFLSLYAQETVEQVLVFRNTGEVNLFYSDRLDSIVCSSFDKDSVLHEEPVSQIFYAKDTTMLIPLAEIDSVAFGNRNVMEFKRDVCELTESGLSWIIRVEENTIFYRKDTPKNILPVLGQKLFCGYGDGTLQTSLFPYGLSARVVSVESSTDAICVNVESVELSEIFSKLFFAGSISEVRPLNVKRRAPVNADLDVSLSVPLGGLGEIGVDGKIGINGEVVVSLFKHYYHADLNLDYGFGFNVSLKSDASVEYNYEELLASRTIATFYRILNLEAAFGAFADVSAEMTLGLEMERTYHRRVLWTRQNGNNSFEIRNADGVESYDEEAKLDLSLDGNIYFGPVLQLDFCVVGDIVGAKAKLKIGPEFNGHLSLGMIRQMHEYNPHFYGNAELSGCGRLSFEGYVTNRPFLAWGDVEEHRIFNFPLRWNQYKISLFPNYVGTRGTQLSTQEAVAVSVATKSEGEIAHEVETGFELVDEQTQEIIDSTFVDIIDANKEDIQGISTDFEVPLKEVQSFQVRPVFHYAGYTVSAAPSHVLKDFQIQPVIFSGSNGVVSYAASYPFTGEVTSDSTNYRAGAYLPILVRDSVFQKEPKTIDIITYIDGSQETKLLGSWNDSGGGGEIKLVFNEDGSGSLNDDVFTYELNVPQSGQILLTFEDKEKSPLILTILRISEDNVQLRIGNEKIICILNKP